jgi:Type III secretion system regulator (LcrR)
MDEITLALRHQGCKIKTAYFENSAIKTGSEFDLYGYRVTYRIERNEFIICYLKKNHCDELPGDFLKLFNFLHHLAESTAGLSSVRMLVIDNIANPVLQSIRHRLIKVLIAKGAVSKNIDGNDWLLFDVGTGE